MIHRKIALEQRNQLLTILFLFSLCNLFDYTLGLNQWLRTQSSSLFNSKKSNIQMIQHFDDTRVPNWEELERLVKQTPKGRFLEEQRELREQGEGLLHADAKIRRFGSTTEPRVTFYRDSAAWCPYCQKVWILLEEKRIPYRVEKINMRSYGDKPQSFIRMVPNGLLPAITLDGEPYTESIDIMLLLDQEFSGPSHPQFWPDKAGAEFERASKLMRLERDLFSRWCNLVFRPSYNNENRKYFDQGLDLVNKELTVTKSPWFLEKLSIVDLQYVTHIERMCASVAYWCGYKIRGDGRWPAIERWFEAFEALPSYLATKADYYTHVMDIPPQYGRPYPVAGYEVLASQIDGRDGSWNLPLPPFQPTDVQPVSSSIDQGEENARHEAAWKLINNHKAVINFALRGAGSPGKKTFQAPLADPYAEPNLTYEQDFATILKHVSFALLQGVDNSPRLVKTATTLTENDQTNLVKSIIYLRDRVGVPRDMSYPAARNLRAHLNWLIAQL